MGRTGLLNIVPHYSEAPGGQVLFLPVSSLPRAAAGLHLVLESDLLSE